MNQREQIKQEKEMREKEQALAEKEMKNRLEIEDKKQKQIDAQSVNQEKMQTQKIQADMALKKMDLRLKEIAEKGAKNKSSSQDKINKMKELAEQDTLDTKKKLNTLRINKSKNSK
jgi:hypothetical protein